MAERVCVLVAPARTTELLPMLFERRTHVPAIRFQPEVFASPLNAQFEKKNLFLSTYVYFEAFGQVDSKIETGPERLGFYKPLLFSKFLRTKIPYCGNYMNFFTFAKIHYCMRATITCS